MAASRDDVVWLSPAQVSERTGFAKQTLQNWRSAREGPQWTKRGRLVRYRADWVDSWLEANAVPARS